MESLGNNSSQLLDLLSAEGDEIEPTRAQSTSKQALYPEVALHWGPRESLTLSLHSTFPSRQYWLV